MTDQVKIAANNIVVGVIHINSATHIYEDFYGDNAHDLAYEMAACDISPEKIENGELDFLESGTILIGFKPCEKQDAWFGHEGEFGQFYYCPDKKQEYSAVVNEFTIQIVRSDYVSFCRRCSPCYPNQGDLNSLECGIVWAYNLPPDMFDPEVDDYPIEKIVRIDA